MPPSDSLNVVASWLDLNEQNYFVSTAGDTIQFFFELHEATVCLGCLESDNLFIVIVVFPVKALKDKRQSVGGYIDLLRQEFINRPVEIGYNPDDGEVRLRLTTDLAIESFDQDLFELMLRKILYYSAKIFPFLNCVMTGAMKPEFAIDQTLAAIQDTPPQ